MEALEKNVVREDGLFYHRLHSWWILLQCWGTLRFSDHRGLSPHEHFSVEGNALTARPTRSNTTGSDKRVTFRLVAISSHCFVAESSWLSVGWSLLKSKADYRRDYLLPAPASGYKGCVRRELRYEAASTVQTRIFLTLHVGVELLFRHKAAKYWTPHSPRNFLPSAAAALNVPKADRDMLGGWAAEESERYARVSKCRITSVQQQVARTFADASSSDPLSELQSLEDFSAFLKREGVSEAECSRYLNLLSKRGFFEQVRDAPLVGQPEEAQEELQLVDDEEETLPAAEPSKIQNWNLGRSAPLGQNPKEARERLRAALAPGFYLVTSTFRNLKSSNHQQFQYMGVLMPPKSQNEQIYKLSKSSCSSQASRTSTYRKKSTGSFFQHRTGSIACLANSSSEEKRTSNAENRMLESRQLGGGAIHNQQHRMVHWLQLVSLANSHSASSVIGPVQGPEGTCRLAQ